MNTNDALKDNYINNLIKDQIFACIYLKNGMRLKGVLTGQDNMCIFLKKGNTQVIYKHRVDTIIPEASSARF